MDYSFKKHSLSEAEQVWLKYAASTHPFDVRVAKVHLRDILPHDFDPNRIDHRLYTGAQITPIGLWHVDPNAPLFTILHKVINTIAAAIIETPGIDQVTASDIAKAAALSEADVAQAFHALGLLGKFFSGGSGKRQGELSTIFLQGEQAYDEYLGYKGIDDVLERAYVSRNLSMKANNVSGITGLYSNSLGTIVLPPYASLQEPTIIKRNTAFVLMAIDPKRPELEDTYNAIKDACKEFGINAYRADEIEHQSRITDLVLDEITACEYLIADLSHERPNVYYEIGYAHALNKKPILYRSKGTRLHFDLSVHNVPEYKNATELRKLLRRRFEAILGHNAKGFLT